MKSGTRDEVEGKMHQFKGRIKGIAGMVIMSPAVEDKGKDEALIGKAQERIGQVKKFVDK